MGSLSAVPGEPGCSFPVLYYHASSNADAESVFPGGGRLTAGVDATQIS